MSNFSVSLLSLFISLLNLIYALYAVYSLLRVSPYLFYSRSPLITHPYLHESVVITQIGETKSSKNCTRPRWFLHTNTLMVFIIYLATSCVRQHSAKDLSNHNTLRWISGTSTINFTSSCCSLPLPLPLCCSIYYRYCALFLY